jgi:Tfp pilus assembly protein PilF
VIPDDEIMLNRPLQTAAGFDWNTVQGMAIRGAEAYRQRNYGQAKEDFSACLKMDPFYMDALTGMAELHFRMMSYDTALVYARRALSIDTYHDKANFIYGLINRRTGRYADAADGFSIAAQSPAYRSASYTQLAQLAVIKKQWSQAASDASRSLAYNKFNLSAYQVMIIAGRKLGNTGETQKLIHTVLEIDPLNHFARFENYLLTRERVLLYEFQNKIHNEFPHETYLELAVTYHNFGLNQESLQILSLAPVNPIVFYWRAYLFANNGQMNESEDLLRKADVQSPYLVFPFRAETAEVLRWAAGRSKNWKSSYYLALICWHLGRPAKARELFTACLDQPDYAPFYLTRAKFFQPLDPEAAIRDCLRAVALDQSNRRAWVQLSELYELTGDQRGSLSALARIYEQNPDDYRVAVPFSGALYRSEKYDSCLKVIEKTNVLPFEGAGEAHRIYNQAHLMSAINAIKREDFMTACTHLDKSRLWPENLGAGKPYDVDERFENYLQMILGDKLAQVDKTDAAINAIISQTEKFRDKPGPNDLFSVLVLNKTGRRREAQTILKKWSQSSAKNFLAFWAMARLDNNINAEKRFYKKIKDKTDIQIYLKAGSLLD